MTEVEIRHVEDAETIHALSALHSYAFGASPQPVQEPRPAEQSDGEPGDGDADGSGGQTRSLWFGAFIDGRPLAVLLANRMRQNVRGLVTPMLGIGGVATDPTARRRGLVRRLMQHAHAECRAAGDITAALWPFRASFYEKFGYVGLPAEQRLRLMPDGLDAMGRPDLPGTVTWHRLSEVVDEVIAFTDQLFAERHGMALSRSEPANWRELTGHESWVAIARTVDGEVIGMLRYRTVGHGDELAGRTLLCRAPLGRALLLRWLAAHVGQCGSFTFALPPGERPELWYTDVQYTDETRIAFPTHTAPMARILDLERLTGCAVGPAVATVEVVDDPALAGTWTLDGTSGALEVKPGSASTSGVPTGGTSTGGVPTATLTSHGLAGLVYGSLDPVEVELRGYGTIPDQAARNALGTLFPPAAPYLFSHF